MASGPNLSKKSLRSVRSRSARSRRVRSGALKAKWQSRSKGSASGWSAAQPIRRSRCPGRPRQSMISLRALASAQRLRRSAALAKQGPHLVGRVVGVLDHPELVALRVELVDQMGGDFHLPAIDVELPPLRSPGHRALPDYLGDLAIVVPLVFLAGVTTVSSPVGVPSSSTGCSVTMAGSPSNSGSANSRVDWVKSRMLKKYLP